MCPSEQCQKFINVYCSARCQAVDIPFRTSTSLTTNGTYLLPKLQRDMFRKFRIAFCLRADVEGHHFDSSLTSIDHSKWTFMFFLLFLWEGKVCSSHTENTNDNKIQCLVETGDHLTIMRPIRGILVIATHVLHFTTENFPSEMRQLECKSELLYREK